MVIKLGISHVPLAIIKQGGAMGIVILGIVLILLTAFILKRINTTNNKAHLKNTTNNKEAMGNKGAEKHSNGILRKENILLNLGKIKKADAIQMAGQLLIDGGYTGQGYIQAMLEREKVVSTYIGNGVAIPHGVGSSKNQIKQSGIVVLQFPQGIDFGDGNTAYLIIGIAGKGDEHLKILSNIAASLENEKVVEKLVNTKNVNDIYDIFISN
jgi:PTS system mannitol-specific IIC component